MSGAERNASLEIVNVSGPPVYGRRSECPPNRNAFTSVVANDNAAKVTAEMISWSDIRNADECRGKRGSTDCHKTRVAVEKPMVATRKKKNAPVERQRYR